MQPDDSKKWGIWYAGMTYMVGHFLRKLGPQSGLWRFPTRQAAQEAISSRWSSNRYEPRMIPNPKPPPGKK